jgi:hypothetical protein
VRLREPGGGQQLASASTPQRWPDGEMPYAISRADRPASAPIGTWKPGLVESSSETWKQRTAASGVSKSTVQQVWSERGLRPHQVETFKLSNDPNIEEKLVDVVGLYVNPPEKAIVLCADEKSSVQALDRTQASLPMVNGGARRASAHETSAAMPADDSPLPKCSIRSQCRWFLQHGRDACAVCPLIITDVGPRAFGGERRPLRRCWDGGWSSHRRHRLW